MGREGRPYLDELLTALDRSLDEAALVYLEHLWSRREELPALHPWAEKAYHQLLRRLENRT